MSPVLGLRPAEKRTVFTSTGVGDLGEVTEEMAATIGCNAGFIRLLVGIEGAKTGFGEAHIMAHEKRIKQLNGLGYNTVVAYVRFVVSAFDRIAAQEDGRLMFLREDGGFHHQVICQWDDDLGIWSTTTAFPRLVVRDLNIVWPAKEEEEAA